MFCLSSPQISLNFSFFRITRVSWNCSDGFVTRTLFLVPPVFYVAFYPGSWAPRCCRHNFIVAVLKYLSFADIENLFYAVIGEITSTPPSTGAGVREYCHNSYNGCFSKFEVLDFRSFLGYVLTDGYSLDVGIVSFGLDIYCFPCIPNTILHNQKVSGVL